MSRQLLPEGQGLAFDGDCLQVSAQAACQALAAACLAGMLVVPQLLPGKQEVQCGGGL